MTKPYEDPVSHFKVEPVWADVESLLNDTIIPGPSTSSSGTTPHTVPTPILESTTEAAVSSGLPHTIAVSRPQGKFLMLLARLSGAEHILEIGTLAGESAIWLAASSPRAKITTVEVDRRYAQVAKKNVEEAGVADRVTVVVGSGEDVLREMCERVSAGATAAPAAKDKKEAQGRAGKGDGKLDFVFIDADKLNNYTYFDYAVKCSRPGSVIVVDNVIQQGGIVDPKLKKENPGARGALEVIEKVAKDDRVDATVLQMVSTKGYDGFMLAVVR